jgi:hypothetical protein
LVCGFFHIQIKFISTKTHCLRFTHDEGGGSVGSGSGTSAGNGIPDSPPIETPIASALKPGSEPLRDTTVGMIIDMDPARVIVPDGIEMLPVRGTIGGSSMLTEPARDEMVETTPRGIACGNDVLMEPVRPPMDTDPDRPILMGDMTMEPARLCVPIGGSGSVGRATIEPERCMPA